MASRSALASRGRDRDARRRRRAVAAAARRLVLGRRCSGTSAGRSAGDGLFHLARVRKLDAFGDLSLRAVDEFADGGLHPGYAFPLWHGVPRARREGLAGSTRRSSCATSARCSRRSRCSSPTRPASRVFRCALGRRRRRWPRRSALYVARAGPRRRVRRARRYPATASRQLLVPAALALFFLAVRGAATGGARVGRRGVARLALVHPTTRSSGCCRSAATRRRARCSRASSRRAGARRARRAAAVRRGRRSGCARSSRRRCRTTRRGPSWPARSRSTATSSSCTRRPLPPRARGRSGAAAPSPSPRSSLVPARGARARGGAGRPSSLGGSLAVLALIARPVALHALRRRGVALAVAPRAPASCRSRSRSPAGVGARAARSACSSLPLALGAGDRAPARSGPATSAYDARARAARRSATWIALVGGARRARRRRSCCAGGGRRERGRSAALAAALLRPAGRRARLAHWSAAPRHRRRRAHARARRALRDACRSGAVVFSDLETSYRIAAVRARASRRRAAARTSRTRSANRPVPAARRRARGSSGPATSRSRAATARAGSSIARTEPQPTAAAAGRYADARYASTVCSR